MAWTLITGASKRLGAAIATTLAKDGHDILIHYFKDAQSAKSIAEICRELDVKSECIQGDFSTQESTQAFIQRLVADFPTVKYLINNVGNYLILPALETKPEQWNELFQINLHAPFAILSALLTSIKKEKGCIINLGVSGLEAFRANTQATTYTATKLSLLFLTKSLAKELAPDQVTVNMVSPGQLDISVDKPKDLNAIPMKRTGTTDEVAHLIAFLLRPENHYITGQNIEVAGGLGL